MMKRLTLLAAVSMLALSAGSAHAAFTLSTSLFMPATVPGSATVVGVQGGSNLTPINGTGYSVTFGGGIAANQGVVQGTNIPFYAVPIAGAMPMTPTGTPEYLTGDYGSSLTTSIAASGKYLSTGTGSITVNFTTPEAAIALLWGSVDTQNTLQLFNGATLVDTVTGSNIDTTPGFTSIGSQGPGGSVYALINGTGGSTFTSAVFSSGINSFELAGVVGSTAPISVPEPASIALLGAGLLGVSFLRRKRS